MFKEDGTYFMFYGGWDQICLATSEDGKNFTRVINDDGSTELFRGPYRNSRDAMVVRRHGLYYCYYTGHTFDDSTIEFNGQMVKQPYQAAIFCRTSPDKKHWSEPVMVSAGGSPAHQDRWYGGDAECPFVLEKDGYFYLFRNIQYGTNSLNYQYASRNPLDFGVGSDKFMLGSLSVAAPEIINYQGKFYMAYLNPGLDGIRITEIHWQPIEQ